MIRQVTAGFLVAAAKTHFQAGSGQETGEGREMQGTADREGSKQACLLPLEERGRAAGSSARFHMASSLGKGWEGGPHQPLSMLVHSSGSMNKDGDLSLVPRNGPSRAVAVPPVGTRVCGSRCDRKSQGRVLLLARKG